MAGCVCKNGLCTGRIPVFSNLVTEIQLEIAQSALHLEKKRGEILVAEGERITSIRIIREGRVKLNRYDEEGKEIIIDILAEGDILGEDLFFESSEALYNAVCVTDVKFCEISRDSLLELIAREPMVAWNMIRYLSQKLKQSNNLLEILQENDSMVRIAKFLLERHHRLQGGEISLSIEDMAASINLRKETVSRKLTQLQSLGYIQRLGQRRIKILDEEALGELKSL